MTFANEIYLRSLASLSRDEIGDRMREAEVLQGFAIVSQAKWLDWNDWDRHSIFAQDNKRVRLVALQARDPGHGAFTRLIGEISKAGLVPVVVEPNERLAGWCKRNFYRRRNIGRGRFRHEVWYPMRCAY